MTNPARIDPFLVALAAFWHEHPDWRFGQLVMNLSRTDKGFADVWEWDVAEFYSRMAGYQAHERAGVATAGVCSTCGKHAQKLYGGGGYPAECERCWFSFIGEPNG